MGQAITKMNHATSTVMSTPNHPLPVSIWCHRFAKVVALATLLLVSVGGHVTTVKAGDTEPSWSLKFWEWFVAWSQLEGGHLYEMTHRQIGTLVGFLTIGLVGILWRTERRRWVRRMGYTALILVVMQGALGGLRVLVVSSPTVQQAAMALTGADHPIDLRIVTGMIHASLGMLIFGLFTALAVATSPRWFQSTAPQNAATVHAVRRLGLITTAVIFLQIVLGAFLRHAGWHMAGVHLHILGAMLVALYAVILVFRAGALGDIAGSVRYPAIVLALAVQVQLFLGIFSYIIPEAIPVRTIHQIVGAVILALCMMLTMRSYHLLEPDHAGDVEPAGGS